MSLSGHSRSQLKAAGMRALKVFYNASKEYSAFPFVSFDQFEVWTRVSDHGDFTFIENFGDSVLIVADRYGWPQVESKLESLANDAEGRVPAFPDGTFQSYDLMQSMVEAVSTVSWRTITVDARKIVEGTAKDVFSLGKLGLAGIAAYYVIGGIFGLWLVYEAAKKKNG